MEDKAKRKRGQKVHDSTFRQPSFSTGGDWRNIGEGPVWKRMITGVLVIIVLGAVLFLTFQGPKETTELSERFREWFRNLGYQGTANQFRSDVHLIEYFIVGIATVVFCKAMGWKPWIGLVAACIFGLLDESIKILLPTREFSAIDLVKDFIGAGIAFEVIMLIHTGKKRKPERQSI